MKPSNVELVINAIATCAQLKGDAEINLEANPTSTEIKKLRLHYMTDVVCNSHKCLIFLPGIHYT